MKIALIHHWYPAIGGTEKYVTALAHEYKKLGHEVFIMTSKPQPKSTPGIYWIKSKIFLRYIIPQKKSAIQILEKLHPDIVHVQSPHPYATIFAKYAKKLKIPVICTFHAPVNPTNPIKKFITNLEHKLYKKLFKKIIVTTEKNKQIVAKFYPSERITVIPLGIDGIFLNNKETKQSARKKLSLNSSQKYVLFVGRMDHSHYYKGIPELLECAAKTPHVSYLLIGDGDKKSEYQKTAADKNCTNVTFLSNVSQEKLPLYFKAADLFVLPSNSTSEGYGLVLLEALTCCTKVITSKFAGSSDELKQVPGWAFISDLQDLDRDIQNFLAQHLPSHKNLNNFLARHTWKKCCQEILKLYQKAL